MASPDSTRHSMASNSKPRIVARIVQSVLDRSLAPGQRLGEQELANHYGVSRTIVREALIELQVRGFVEVRPRLGWYVVEPSFEEAQETYAARRIVEPSMLRDSGPPLQSVIRRLRRHVVDERKAIASSDAATRATLLADFHVCLAECLGNRFITALMVDLSARTTLVSALYQSTDQARFSSDDHEAIVEALAAGDGAAAERLMREHIDRLAASLADKHTP